MIPSNVFNPIINQNAALSTTTHILENLAEAIAAAGLPQPVESAAASCAANANKALGDLKKVADLLGIVLQ